MSTKKAVKAALVPADPGRPAWPADAVFQRRVADLVPYARNARLHSDAQVEQIAKSIRQFGWTVPVLCDENGGIIAGHGRILAAKRLGIAVVPVMVAVGWSEEQRRAYVLADNKLTLNGEWDDELLKLEIADLLKTDFDVSVIGFSETEMAALTISVSAGEVDPDETPEAPASPVSVPGDIWELGNHRIICGDSTDADVVGKLLGSVKPHLMVTDPPCVEYDANWRNVAARNSSAGMGNRALGAGAVGKVLNDDRADWREAWALFPGDVAYVWHAGLFAGTVLESLQAAGFKARSQIIWAKSHFAIGRGDYHWQHEPCWYAVRDKVTGHWAGDRKQSTIWAIEKPQKSETGHSTQKPVECMKRPIENNSSIGQAIYEPFSGSGTTIIAGEMTGRFIYAVELNPAYVDVAITRWATFTAKTPILLDTGETYAEVAARRLPAQTPSVTTKKPAGTRKRKDEPADEARR